MNQVAMKLYVSIIMVVSAIQDCSSQCHGKTIDTCTCQQYEDQLILKTHIICQNVQDIRKTLTKFDVRNENLNLILVHMNKKIIPESFLQGFEISTMRISIGEFIKLPNFFLNYSSNILEELHLVDTALEEIPNLSHMTILNSLAIIGPRTNINIIRKNATNNMPDSLESIILSNINAKIVEMGAFKKFKKLKTLTLKDNKLSHLPLDTVPENLRYLYMSNNIFKRVPQVKAFEGLKNLQAVDLAFNKIEDLTEEDSAILKQNIDLYLIKNGLKCSCKMSWVPKYLDNGNNLMAVASLKCAKHPGKTVKDLTEKDFRSCGKSIVSL